MASAPTIAIRPPPGNQQVAMFRPTSAAWCPRAYEVMMADALSLLALALMKGRICAATCEFISDTRLHAPNVRKDDFAHLKSAPVILTAGTVIAGRFLS